MGCCFCCLSEGDKVARVLGKFPPMPASQAQDNMLCKVVGRCVLAGTAPLYAPASGRPCVYYKIKVEKERIERRRREDGSMETIRSWDHVCTDERFMDFYVQDGHHKVFINGAQRNFCRIQATTDTRGSSSARFFDTPPPGVMMLLAARDVPDHYGRERDTGRYRYSESKFEVNELIAAMGVPTPATDPFTGQPVKSLLPFREDTMNDELFEKLGFDDWDKRSWEDLVKSPAVLLSDDQQFTAGVAVAPIQQLPPWMTTYDPARCNPQMYGAAPGTAPPQGWQHPPQ